ncbi:putative Chemotaxis protein [Candidatus Terasakiella magnetica]|uniref:Putative Chemotaxis protein n=1 Tax=Candidatus Terasakiella magnetica TaxID=1867952 RepID=A0A1C3REF2_9PROT|nr:protein phosphatase CheZ [Candidatus Terasakiella magnetica]SCA55663.1 putative Chemotaxis protein [Candidatus Terasakiella magnetica]
MAEQVPVQLLAEQILHLVDYITKIKSELAAIKHPKSSVDHFNTVSDQLNTICETTEDATNTIMESAEDILNSVEDLSANVKYPEAQNSCNNIQDSTNKIFESCSFHDLTGQRISKIVRIMNKLEGTLDSLVEIVGRKGLEEMPVDENETIEDAIGMRDGDIAMHGPDVVGQEVSQDDIDALFGNDAAPAPNAQVSQDAIDNLFDSPAPVSPPAKEPAAPASAVSSQSEVDALFDAEPAPAAKEPAPKPKEPKKEAAAPAPGGQVSQDDIDKLFG